MARPYPELLTPEEDKALLATAERVWRELQENQLGGYSGCNRPFWLHAEFKAVIEKFGHRDIGQTWTKDQLDAAKARGDAPPPRYRVTMPREEPKRSLRERFLLWWYVDRLCQCPPPFIPQSNGTCGVCARPDR